MILPFADVGPQTSGLKRKQCYAESCVNARLNASL